MNPKNPELKEIVIYTDGGSRGNPGPAAIGGIIKDSQGKTIHKFGEKIGIATNNVAEYQALIFAITWIIKNKNKLGSLKSCHFFLDSALVVNQLNGLWKVKNSNMRQQIICTRQLEADLRLPIKYTAISREKNIQADTLLNQALNRQ